MGFLARIFARITTGYLGKNYYGNRGKNLGRNYYGNLGKNLTDMSRNARIGENGRNGN